MKKSKLLKILALTLSVSLSQNVYSASLTDSADTIVNESTEETLSSEQKNSLAMLNYLAMITQEINASKNSRLFLEEAYSSILNNMNPGEVNILTQSHLNELLDIIEQYRIINVKRERLQYIYEQNKAMAIQAAIPNPISLLSVTNATDIKKLAASVIYMAVDSVASYQQYSAEVDNEFLQSGWALDDEESANLHESRTRTFAYMIETVRENNIPGKLALSEKNIEDFVSWKNEENIHQKLQFLESEYETYKMFGDYWLELTKCYYDIGDYGNCLDAALEYENIQSNIFRKDYQFAEVIPSIIAAVAEVYTGQDYIDKTDKYISLLLQNTEKSDWALRYFAAQMYLNLYAETNDIRFLDDAYDIVLDNVNVLSRKQKQMNEAYLGKIKKVSVPKDATKKEKKQIEEYNKSLEKERKTDLPPVYEPLRLNCELLLGIIEERGLEDWEFEQVDGILSGSGEGLFLTLPLNDRYSLYETEPYLAQMELYEMGVCSIPVVFLSEASCMRVTVTDGGKEYVYEDWEIDKVERPKKNIESFTADVWSTDIDEQKWSEDSKVKIEIFNGTEEDLVTAEFEISEYKKRASIIPDTIKFEQVG